MIMTHFFPRPGSIQTAAQEKFVHKFERAYYTLLHVFPLREPESVPPLPLPVVQPAVTSSSDKLTSALSSLTFPSSSSGSSSSRSGRRRSTNVSSSSAPHSKTIAQSVRDQQYTLTAEERRLEKFRWRHRFVCIAVNALSRLSADDFNIATLAITGLTKLVPKNNHRELPELGQHNNSNSNAPRELHNSHHHDQITGGAGKRSTSFMVASNALSDCSEEGIMDDMKLEINVNKYSRLLDVADIVASALKMDTSAAVAGTSGGSKLSLLSNQKSLSRLSRDSSVTEIAAPSQPPSAAAAAVLSAATIARHAASSPPTESNMSAVNPSNPRQTSSAVDSSLTRNKSFNDASTSSVGSGSSLPRLRGNSFKQNSVTDYAKSKRMSSNLLGQLLLDWLETRRNPLLEKRNLDELAVIWKRFTDATSLTTPFQTAQSIRGG